jgi:hypothetical protein
MGVDQELIYVGVTANDDGDFPIRSIDINSAILYLLDLFIDNKPLGFG